MPSVGRMDELIRAVRTCPSGALFYGFDATEAREEVDYHGGREPAIEVSRGGPYRVTGGIPLRDGEGNDEPRNEGASREHYALCRCGHSQNKPFCSGMHWYVDFNDPVPERLLAESTRGGKPVGAKPRVLTGSSIVEDRHLLTDVGLPRCSRSGETSAPTYRRDAVGDRVVQLAGDPQPLGVHPPGSLLLAGALGLLGPVADLGHERPAVGHRPAEEQRRADEPDGIPRRGPGRLAGEDQPHGGERHADQESERERAGSRLPRGHRVERDQRRQ